MSAPQRLSLGPDHQSPNKSLGQGPEAASACRMTDTEPLDDKEALLLKVTSKRRGQAVPKVGADSTDFKVPPNLTDEGSEAGSWQGAQRPVRRSWAGRRQGACLGPPGLQGQRPGIITGHHPGITRTFPHKEAHSLLKFPGDSLRRRAVHRERYLLSIAGSPL